MRPDGQRPMKKPKAKSTEPSLRSHDYYIAMTSLTGPNEAWYVGASESHAALA